MIDIHCHILPNVDDGSKSIDESIEMARIAESEGIKKIVNTSHYHSEFKYKSGEELQSILDEFNKKLEEENIGIEILLGNEIFYTEDSIHTLENEKFYTINKSKYILVEFSPVRFPKNIVEVVYEIKLMGYVPILAHVERYIDVQNNPNILFDAIKEGALIQLNASSILGKNGEDAKTVSNILLKNNMAHVVATDAHGSLRRRPLARQAYDYVYNEIGQKIAEELFYLNPERIISNLDVDIHEPIKYQRKKSFINKIFNRK